MSTTGGANLMRHIREAKAQSGETVVEVGFKGPVATLAAQHEWGNPRARLPERPAFRRGLRQAEPELQEWLLHLGRVPTDEDKQEFALMLLDRIKQGYLEFEGQPLSERQQQRKIGTPGQGRQLVGSEGPKLIEHLTACVNEVLVGGGRTVGF